MFWSFQICRLLEKAPKQLDNFTFQLLVSYSTFHYPSIPPCSSHSSQTSTRPPWGWQISVGSGCWLLSKQRAGNGSDLQTRSMWSAPLPFCLGSTAQGSLERQRSRLKIGDHKEKLHVKNLICSLNIVPVHMLVFNCLTTDKTKETNAHNGTRVTYLNPRQSSHEKHSSERIL